MTGVTDLRAQRMVLGLSQSELARLLGVSRWSVARWESGERAVPKAVDGLMYALTAKYDVEVEARDTIFHYLQSR